MTTPLSKSELAATCPFCGLLCDDGTVRSDGAKLEQVRGGCNVSRAALALVSSGAVSRRVEGGAATLDEAAAKAGALLRGATRPLFAGLATDVAGMRAVLALADRCGAVLDHMNSSAKFRNLLVLQDSGWISTTLAEIRNRADLLVLVGTDVVSRFPRFFERAVWNRESLFELDPAAREIVYLGQGLDVSAGVAPDGRQPERVACEVRRLGEGLGALRALLAGRRLQAAEAAGVPTHAWRGLAEKLRGARYAVFVWSAADLDLPHAELTVRSLCELVKDLNRSTRAAVLPLGGSDGDFTADAVELWQTGFPFRSDFGRGYPAYDPHRFSASRLLDGGEADVLLWIASLDPTRQAPAVDIPTIVLGHAAMRFDREPDVFIPVGTPGIDHAGHMFRADKVVALPLRKLRESGLPSVAQALAAISDRL
jgi:formylmethanofuran dehydrogenase subunit B